jgi:hypothetical protein
MGVMCINFYNELTKKNAQKLGNGRRFSLRWRATAAPEKWEAPDRFSSLVSVSFRYNHSCTESLFHSHVCPLKTAGCLLVSIYLQVLYKICTEPKRLHKRNDDRKLKGTVSRDFLLLVFFDESVSPQPQSIALGPFRIFSKIRGNDTGGK